MMRPLVSQEHQRLVNALAGGLESRWNVEILEIDIRGTPELFEAKYRGLPQPAKRGGRTPDLVGRDSDGTNHLGEAETDMAAENLDGQLRAFSGRTMTGTNTPVPLHVIVPERIKSQMDSRIASLRQSGWLGDGEILVWSMPGW